MGEMLFGSAPQIWPQVSVPAFGQVQAFPGGRAFANPQGLFGPRLAPFASVGMPSAPMQAGPAPDPGQLSTGQLGTGQLATAQLGPAPAGGAGMQTLAGSDFAMGITPQALLATVAMRRGQPIVPTSDQEIEDFVYDALDLLSGATDVEARCEGGKVLLAGSVSNKRVKRDIGEIAWAIPSVNDVQNNITIAARRRSRGQAREAEAAAGAARKQG
jgi:hypothetical protein